MMHKQKGMNQVRAPAVELSDVGLERRVRIGFHEHRFDGVENISHVECGRPVVCDNVCANLSRVQFDVGVVDLGCELHLGRGAR